MTSGTPEQIRQALSNTLQRLCNHAPSIFQAIRNDKARWRRASSIIGQMTITGVTHG